MFARLVAVFGMTALVWFAPDSVQAQHLFKCGATYQDRPCPAQDTQSRFSATAGSFSVSQVNADTDRDCARFAGDALPFWRRMDAGEPFESLKAEVDAKSISRYDKSQMRDVLIALKQYKGTPRDVQSQLETQCMNYKRSRGLPTELEMARAARARDARAGEAESAAQWSRDRADEMRVRSEEYRVAREEQARARAAAAAARAARAAANRQ